MNKNYPCHSPSSYAQDTYQYIRGKDKTLLNIADSSKIIVATESKNRHLIISNKHEYVLSREKGFGTLAKEQLRTAYVRYTIKMALSFWLMKRPYLGDKQKRMDIL